MFIFIETIGIPLPLVATKLSRKKKIPPLAGKGWEI